MSDLTKAATLPPGEAVADPAHVLSIKDISKTFGPTLANNRVSIEVSRGDVLGLVGANGAGKSTLMRILAGVMMPDSGTLSVAGSVVDLASYTPQTARRLGIRFVHQELSLCDNLSVVENFYLEAPHLGAGPLAWRSYYTQLARLSLEAIFPDSGIDLSARLGMLPIAQRQMVEIARAASDPHLSLLILDEPTSSLGAQRSEELRRYITRRAASGTSFIFISHRLREITLTCRRILVMRGGSLVRDAKLEAIGMDQIVELMIGNVTRAALVRGAPTPAGMDAKTLIELPTGSRFAPNGLQLRRGEVIGVAGLEGNGQRAFLHALYAARSTRGGRHMRVEADIGYVSGDRASEGTFALWTVLMNATLSGIARQHLLRLVNASEDRKMAGTWLSRVQIEAARMDSPIVELSGGNQQKVLMARALIGNADVIVLDDPTRGVDVAVKGEFYHLIAEAAARGKLIIWYSSEDIEFLECSRVLLFHDGRIVETLVGEAISEDAIIGKSFGRRTNEESAAGIHRPAQTRGRVDVFRLIPFLILAMVFVLIALLNHSAATMFGVDLLMGAAVPLVIIALGQMFVLGGSEIDLGIGAFAGLVNVLSATALVEVPAVGAMWLACCLTAYCVLGLMIYLRQIPSLVVTLGASFIWGGIGYALQPTPGGASPAWLTATAEFRAAGVPASLWMIVLAAAAGALINGSRTGVVLRGFGNNPRALVQGGWSPVKYYLIRYFISGSCALLAGLSLTAVNAASDINAGGPYTLLSVAAAVIGGCALSGGSIAPIGVVCGAVTLSLIGALLGFLSVSTDFNAAVQGGLLVAILMIRILSRREPA